MKHLTRTQLRALRCSPYLPYRPSGALKVVRFMESQVRRLPYWLMMPAFYLYLMIIEFTPLGMLARMDLLTERLYPADDPR